MSATPAGDLARIGVMLANDGRQGANLVVVVLAGNYNKKGAWRLPDRIIEDFVLPALTG